MTLQLSKNELQRLKVSWLASTDITSPVLIKEFSIIWKETIIETESILKKCNFQVRLDNFKKIGLTINSKVTFSFDPIKETFLFNVWSFLFSHDAFQAYCRPAFLLSNELVHEYPKTLNPFLC
jgi:hypothetical protein